MTQIYHPSLLSQKIDPDATSCKFGTSKNFKKPGRQRRGYNMRSPRLRLGESKDLSKYFNHSTCYLPNND